MFLLCLFTYYMRLQPSSRSSLSSRKSVTVPEVGDIFVNRLKTVVSRRSGRLTKARLFQFHADICHCHKAAERFCQLIYSGMGIIQHPILLPEPAGPFLQKGRDSSLEPMIPCGLKSMIKTSSARRLPF